MELPEYDIPKSIFLYLSLEYTSFCLAYTDPVTILRDELFSPPFPDPVAYIVSEHRSEDSRDDGQYDMLSSPESSDENHHVHPWYRCPDEWE
jgi:hypothetical protein